MHTTADILASAYPSRHKRGEYAREGVERSQLAREEHAQMLVLVGVLYKRFLDLA